MNAEYRLPLRPPFGAIVTTDHVLSAEGEPGRSLAAASDTMLLSSMPGRARKQPAIAQSGVPAAISVPHLQTANSRTRVKFDPGAVMMAA